MKTPQTYIDHAVASFEAGFTSQASQKEALSNLNMAYEILSGGIMKAILNTRVEGEMSKTMGDLYDMIPFNLHQWKARHSSSVDLNLPAMRDSVNQIEALCDLREAIKSAEVVKAERKEDSRAVAIQKSIREIMNLRKAQYERGLKVWDLFNGLPVTVNVHMVTNQHGTEFLRAFYFLNGAMTPLSVILAVMEAKAPTETK